MIGTSAGGLTALQRPLSQLPASLPAAVFIVMDSAPEPGSKLAEILARWGPLPAHSAIHGERIAPGRIYVAPPRGPGRHDRRAVLATTGSEALSILAREPVSLLLLD
ncbi:MAG: chemotaxis protein CheB, partial [Myxococcaceae bacterium]